MWGDIGGGWGRFGETGEEEEEVEEGVEVEVEVRAGRHLSRM